MRLVDDGETRACFSGGKGEVALRGLVFDRQGGVTVELALEGEFGKRVPGAIDFAPKVGRCLERQATGLEADRGPMPQEVAQDVVFGVPERKLAAAPAPPPEREVELELKLPGDRLTEDADVAELDTILKQTGLLLRPRFLEGECIGFG
jgi:hypothetical protein